MANEEPNNDQPLSQPVGMSRALTVTTTADFKASTAAVALAGRNLAYDKFALGLPGQINDMPTAPLDRGDEVQDRFRYQWAIGAVLLAEGIIGKNPCTAIWCEHHEDLLVELPTGVYIAVQVKTLSGENARWRVNDPAFVGSLQRFCELETKYGNKIAGYEFCSNAPPYVVGASTESEKTRASSPISLHAACQNATDPAFIPAPFDGVFQVLCNAIKKDRMVLFAVLRKLAFRLGPPLRGYLDTLVAQTIPALPNCAYLPTQRLRAVRDELMRLVETACGIPSGGIDGVLAYIAANGRPEVSIRGKCILLSAARTCVDQAGQSTFRYVRCGESIQLGQMQGQKTVLHKKMRNAFLDGQFEPLWMRAMAAEQRLLEKAIAEPERIDALVTQLESTVLVECKDAEILATFESDERKRGTFIYRTVLQNLTDIAVYDPERVCNEPKDTLLGVAGMLSGSCRFAWGVPMEGDDNGA